MVSVKGCYIHTSMGEDYQTEEMSIFGIKGDRCQ